MENFIFCAVMASIVPITKGRNKPLRRATLSIVRIPWQIWFLIIYYNNETTYRRMVYSCSLRNISQCYYCIYPKTHYFREYFEKKISKKLSWVIITFKQILNVLLTNISDFFAEKKDKKMTLLIFAFFHTKSILMPKTEIICFNWRAFFEVNYITWAGKKSGLDQSELGNF